MTQKECEFDCYVVVTSVRFPRGTIGFLPIPVPSSFDFPTDSVERMCPGLYVSEYDEFPVGIHQKKCRFRRAQRETEAGTIDLGINLQYYSSVS